jgi:ubiquinol-cytochrome c reductase cytochrome c1 subunit
VTVTKRMTRTIPAALLATAMCATAMPAIASSDVEHPMQQVWAFDGFFGKFDKPSIQRGFQVYKEVCSACHGIKRVSFRTLQDVGFSEAEVKALAAGYSFPSINDAGDTVERPGLPSDYFPSPYANENAARGANNGALPPDLSLIVKARHDGANYIYSLLTGYKDAPEGVTLTDGQYYNPYFPGGKIGMPAPLSDGQVTFEDGTANTVDQMTKDVVNFLQWTAEPEMEQRKRMGVRVMLFLGVATIFFAIAKHRVWRKVYSGEV